MKQSTLLKLHNITLTQRSALLVWLAASAVLNMILGGSIFFLIGKERIVVVPPVTANEFWVASDTVSDSYLEQWSECLANLILNVTPNNFKARSEHLLSHVDAGSYQQVKERLIKEQAEIERRGLSSMFHINAFRVDRPSLTVEMKGNLRTWVGNAPLEAKERVYQIKFIYRHGRLYIQSFNEVGNA